MKGKITMSEWTKALDEMKVQAETVPKGFKTIWQIVEDEGTGYDRVRRLVGSLVKAGRAEVRSFKIKSGARAAYPVPHYRLK